MWQRLSTVLACGRSSSSLGWPCPHSTDWVIRIESGNCREVLGRNEVNGREGSASPPPACHFQATSQLHPHTLLTPLTSLKLLPHGRTPPTPAIWAPWGPPLDPRRLMSGQELWTPHLHLPLDTGGWGGGIHFLPLERRHSGYNLSS